MCSLFSVIWSHFLWCESAVGRFELKEYLLLWYVLIIKRGFRVLWGLLSQSLIAISFNIHLSSLFEITCRIKRKIARASTPLISHPFHPQASCLRLLSVYMELVITKCVKKQFIENQKQDIATGRSTAAFFTCAEGKQSKYTADLFNKGLCLSNFSFS